MNLTTGKWIPVVWADGHADKVSLMDVFQQGENIRDLAVHPHERIALMRLLICIVQAALDGPKDRDDWQTCREKLPKVAADYLAKWKHAFELFGDGQRFLQVESHEVETDEDGSGDVSKLNLSLAAGNNTTLFDNAGGSGRCFSEAEIALNLLAYQNYSPLVGRGYKGRSPCIEYNMLHTYALMSNLLATICCNLLTVEQVEMYIGKGAWGGRPVWEVWDDVLKLEEDSISKITSAYLGRLCPVERAIWLNENGINMQMKNGLEYPAFREATATIVPHKKTGERVPLSAIPGRGIWRDLSSIVVKKYQEKDIKSGPLALNNHDGVHDVIIWSGALISDGKSKLIDSVDSAYQIPVSMFSDAGRNLYQNGVDLADKKVGILGKAIATYRRAQKDEIEGDMWKRGVKVKQKATAHYWTAIEQQVPLLLIIVKNPALLDPENSGKEHWHGTEWGRVLARAARDAYELACPHDTPRQMRAYCAGLNVLFKSSDSNENQPATEEEDA